MFSRSAATVERGGATVSLDRSVADAIAAGRPLQLDGDRFARATLALILLAAAGGAAAAAVVRRLRAGP